MPARGERVRRIGRDSAAGAIDSPYQFHWRRFLFEQFPKGTAFPALPVPTIKDTLPLAPVEAFSIDDSATTEIDDALSVQGLGSGKVTLGIHIAAPGLAFAPDSPVDRVARERDERLVAPELLADVGRIGDVVSVRAPPPRRQHRRAVHVRHAERLEIRNARAGVVQRELRVELETVGGGEAGHQAAVNGLR